MSGKEFVHALVLGNEIQCRVGGILFTPPAECRNRLVDGGTASAASARR